MARKQRRPKLKTHKAAAARVHITGGGTMLRLHGHRSHFRRRKTASTKRLYEHKEPVSASDARKIRRLVPHGGA